MFTTQKIAVAALFAVIVGVAAILSLSGVLFAGADRDLASVEVGYTELSPQGVGQAVPASASSVWGPDLDRSVICVDENTVEVTVEGDQMSANGTLTFDGVVVDSDFQPQDVYVAQYPHNATYECSASVPGDWVGVDTGDGSTWTTYYSCDIVAPDCSNGPGLSCSVDPINIETDQSATWTATVTEALGWTYTYQWSGTNGLSGTATSVTKTYTAADGPGVKTASITAFWGTSSTTQVCSTSLNVVDPPLVSCSADADDFGTGQSVRWTATVSGGTGAYTYSWSGTDGLTGSSSIVDKVYTTTGEKTAQVTVTAGNGNPVTAQCTNGSGDGGGDAGGPGGGGGGPGSPITIHTPPSVDLKANGQDAVTIGIGDSADLTWTSSNANTCNGTLFSTGGDLNNSTGVEVTPAVTTTYSILCTGLGGSDSDTATVTVVDPGNITLTADPTIVTRGDFTQLTVSGSGVDESSCTVTGDNGYTNGPGTITLGNGFNSNAITSETVFTATCDSLEPGFAPRTDSVTVRTRAQFEEI